MSNNSEIEGLEEEDEEMMEMPSLVDFLVSADGTPVAEVLNKGLAKISSQIETQNKILIKLLSALKPN
jgi:hypothetical protein